MKTTNKQLRKQILKEFYTLYDNRDLFAFKALETFWHKIKSSSTFAFLSKTFEMFDNLFFKKVFENIENKLQRYVQRFKPL